VRKQLLIQLTPLFQERERFGVVDALISGAGGNSARATTSREAGFFDLPCEAFCDVMGLNVVGTVLPVQVFGSYMARQGRGRIVNIVSVIAERPLTNVPAYAAGKAAVKNFTQWLAVHVSHNYSTDIRVNGLAPGFFLTDQNRYLLTDAETGEPTERGKTIIDHTPLGRYGDPEELLAAVLWLLSPGASFVHGATIVVDGGFTAFSGV